MNRKNKGVLSIFVVAFLFYIIGTLPETLRLIVLFALVLICLGVWL